MRRVVLSEKETMRHGFVSPGPSTFVDVLHITLRFLDQYLFQPELSDCISS